VTVQPTAHERLTRAGMCAAFADLVLDQHAAELAEQIREDTTVVGEAGDQYALLYADLIDPKVQR
jgi:hypothetical protein